MRLRFIAILALAALAASPAQARYYPGSQFPTPSGDNGSPGVTIETAPGVPATSTNPLATRPAAVPGAGTALGYQQLTSMSTGSAVNLPSIPIGATAAVIVCTGAIVYRQDGPAPTATVGMPLPAGASFLSTFVAAFLMIPVATGTICNIDFYK